MLKGVHTLNFGNYLHSLTASSPVVVVMRRKACYTPRLNKAKQNLQFCSNILWFQLLRLSLDEGGIYCGEGIRKKYKLTVVKKYEVVVVKTGLSSEGLCAYGHASAAVQEEGKQRLYRFLK